LLKRGYNRSRSIDLLPVKGKLKQAMGMAAVAVRRERWIRLPLMGRIAAGMPIEAVETPETILIARLCAIEGSLRPAGFAGNRCRMSTLSTATTASRENEDSAQGDIVAAFVDGSDSTLKRFYKEGDKIGCSLRMRPWKPIIVSGSGRQPPRPSHRVMRKYA